MRGRSHFDPLSLSFSGVLDNGNPSRARALAIFLAFALIFPPPPPLSYYLVVALHVRAVDNRLVFSIARWWRPGSDGGESSAETASSTFSPEASEYASLSFGAEQ